MKEKGRKDKEKIKAEMSILKNEIVKLKKENLGLKKQIEELEENKYNQNIKIDNDENILNNKDNQKKDNIYEIEYINNFSYLGQMKKAENIDIINNNNNRDEIYNIFT